MAFTTPACFWKTVDLSPRGNKLDINVSVTLILGALEYVALKILLIMERCAWKLCFLPYFTLVSVMIS
jgi:hypothetical protein